MSELKLREHMDASLPAAVYVCDAEGCVRGFNARAAELWGRAPALGDSDERFCGAFRLWRPDGTPLPHASTPMAEVLATGEPRHNLDVSLERPDGTFVDVRVNIEPLFDDKRTLIGAVNVFQATGEPYTRPLGRAAGE